MATSASSPGHAPSSTEPVARERPAPTAITSFQLALAVGGALGGAFNALIAPRGLPARDHHDAGAWHGLLVALLGRGVGYGPDGPVRTTWVVMAERAELGALKLR